MEDSPLKIYTKQGDRGQTSLLGGETVEKDDCRVSAYGALDELQSLLGVARTLAENDLARSILFAVQKSIFVASSELASTHQDLSLLESRITGDDVCGLEEWIDQLTELYGLPGHFVMPGTSLEGSAMHMARAVCRRCERAVVKVNRNSGGAYSQCVVYFNRLSDLLFVLAWSLDVRAVVKEVLRSMIAEK